MPGGGWRHDNANWHSKLCPVCNTQFKPNSGVHKFCSTSCKDKWKYISGSCNTETQYKNISGNWERYFARLCCRSRKRQDIKVNDLLKLLEKQNGLCALSGIELTCILEKGKKIKTNASIDRIEAGKSYSIDNIQLVCSALNSWRNDTDLQEFIWFCNKVTKHQSKKGGHDAIQ
jgi:hypothetical protein